MNKKIVLVIPILIGLVAANCFATTIPAGTVLTVQTVGVISSQSVVGRSFETKLAQNLSVKGKVVAPAGTKAFGKITSSRANPRKSGPLSVELASIEVNGRRVPVKTSSINPTGPVQEAIKAHVGATAGTTVVNPGSRMQFQLLQPVTL
jgi:hypothetical protein